MFLIYSVPIAIETILLILYLRFIPLVDKTTNFKTRRGVGM